MEIGMLWMDTSPGRDLANRMEEAAKSFRAQYGVLPSLCIVGESGAAKGIDSIKGIAVKTSRQLLPGYFWIGTAEFRLGGPTLSDARLEEKRSKG